MLALALSWITRLHQVTTPFRFNSSGACRAAFRCLHPTVGRIPLTMAPPVLQHFCPMPVFQEAQTGDRPILTSVIHSLQPSLMTFPFPKRTSSRTRFCGDGLFRARFWLAPPRRLTLLMDYQQQDYLLM